MMILDIKTIHLAKELLTVYGDSVPVAHIGNFKALFSSRDKDNVINNPDMLSVRCRAIYTYLQRVLRPVWDMNLTYRKKYEDYVKQISNLDMFYPCLTKLKMVRTMLDHYVSDFYRQTTEHDQANLMKNQYMSSKGITNKHILREVHFSMTLNAQDRDTMERLEIHCLQNMILMTQRCIDVIEFFRIISFDQGGTSSNQK